ncbi:hypothetical protein [Paenibacillus sinopodophylli]|uniref:hypothetical protein n=1 Tax=Paenibacillus sinopodophylli TaxID=1837342 RepID=UPI00110CFCAC|nr:hypothetical protein [Paenibacillus sinopodophylli]
MIVYAALGTILATITIVWWEVRLLTHKKEKNAVISISLGACLLAMLLLFLPEIPGPTEFVVLLLGFLDK